MPGRPAGRSGRQARRLRGYYTEPMTRERATKTSAHQPRAEREAAFTAMHCIPTRHGADRPDRLRRVPTIPGVSGAEGLVGPPLDRMGKRVYIAGVLRDTPDNMITWLRNPQSFVPNNAMPNMGIDQQQARDIAAYLYTLD
jgi:cytochrome c1